MIHHCNVSLDDLQQQKKGYPWNRPEECPRCKGNLWGHGYVLRYFNSHSEGLSIKRWRCPSCRLVITCRPSSHWRRFQESVENIFQALIDRVKCYKWPPWTTRQRGGHWLSLLTSHAKINLLEKKNQLETILFYKEKNLAIF